jgi:hypothetical protein
VAEAASRGLYGGGGLIGASSDSGGTVVGLLPPLSDCGETLSVGGG